MRVYKMRNMWVHFSASVIDRYRNPLTVYCTFSNSTDPEEGPVCKTFTRVITVRELWLLTAASLVRHRSEHMEEMFFTHSILTRNDTPALEWMKHQR